MEFLELNNLGYIVFRQTGGVVCSFTCHFFKFDCHLSISTLPLLSRHWRKICVKVEDRSRPFRDQLSRQIPIFSSLFRMAATIVKICICSYLLIHLKVILILCNHIMREVELKNFEEGVLQVFEKEGFWMLSIESKIWGL